MRLYIGYMMLYIFTRIYFSYILNILYACMSIIKIEI
jgi:hypothetical protein